MPHQQWRKKIISAGKRYLTRRQKRSHERRENVVRRYAVETVEEEPRNYIELSKTKSAIRRQKLKMRRRIWCRRYKNLVLMQVQNKLDRLSMANIFLVLPTLTFKYPKDK